MDNNAGKILFIIAGTTLAIILGITTLARAGDCNGPGDDCGFECTNETGAPVTVTAVCTTVVENDVDVYCGAYAEAICLAEAEAYCGQACEAACSQSVSVVCPPPTVCPTVRVQDRIEKCKSVKVTKAGAIRKRGCTSFLSADQAVCEE